MERRKTRTRNRFAQYQGDPDGIVRFIQNELFGFIWSKQQAICRSVVANRFTAVPSCHGAGKTGIAARIGAAWLSIWPAGEAFLVTSAPTGQQVKGLLWREINKIHAAGQLPGRCNQTEWYMPPNELVGWGRAVRDTDPTAFQGIHARRVLVILDEGCGVTKAIFDAAETLVTNEDSRFLVIGNPDDPSSQFAIVCKPGSGYNVIPISAFDTPNFTDEDVPDFLRHVLVGKTWVEERKRRWGEKSPLYVAKVLGRFPDVSTDGLIPISALQEAANADRDLPEEDPAIMINELGVDVARFGNDKTTIYHRLGIMCRRVGELHKRDETEVAGRVIALERLLRPSAIKIDDSGLGGGVTDILNEARFEGRISAKIVPVNVGMSPTSNTDEERYYNLRAQLHWMMRERFMAGAVMLLPPIDAIESLDVEVDDLDDYLAQAGSIKYKFNSRGQIVVESKDDMKKRDLPSPDDFDGSMLAFAPANLGGEMVLPFQAPEIRIEAIPVPRFWPQMVVIHIERQTFSAIWAAHQDAKDVVYVTEEYVAPLGELAVHADAVKRRSRTRDGRDWAMPTVFTLKTPERSRDEGVRLAVRLSELDLNIVTLEETPIEVAIPDMAARMAGQRLKGFSTLSHWFAEVARFRKDGDGDVLDGNVPLMHATSTLLQALPAAMMESQHDLDEDEAGRDQGRRNTANRTTGY